MKKVLKELLSIQPNIIGGKLEAEKTIVNVDYTATGIQYQLEFVEDQLKEVKLKDELGGGMVLFGESIGTDFDILNEICFEIHPKTIQYKSEIF